MTRKIYKTMKEREDRIMEIASTEYDLKSDGARDYLVAIEGTGLEEQQKLFALILRIHKLCRIEKCCHSSETSMIEKDWDNSVKRVSDTVDGWSRMALRNNAPLEETANMLWDNLCLFEGRDRIVALGLLLSRPVAPYIQLPPDIALLKPQSVYDEAHAQILAQIALLDRVLEIEKITMIEVAAALVRILDQIEEPEGRVMLIGHFIKKMEERTKMPSIIEGIILGPFSFGSKDKKDE